MKNPSIFQNRRFALDMQENDNIYSFLAREDFAALQLNSVCLREIAPCGITSRFTKKEFFL